MPVLKTILLRILPVAIIYVAIIEIIKIADKASPSGPCTPGGGILLLILYMFFACPIIFIINIGRLILKKTKNASIAVTHVIMSIFVLFYFFCLTKW